MAEMEVGYNDLLREVTRFLGWKAPADCTAEQLAISNGIVESGIRQYMHPLNPDTGQMHSWSFLNSSEITIPLVSGTSVYSLPATFDGFDGSLSFENGRAIDTWARERIQQCYHDNPAATGDPQAVAIYPDYASTTGTAWEMIVYPTPARSASLVGFAKHFIASLPDETNTRLPGGAVHAEGYIESCLSVAELRINDLAGGPHKAAYTEILRANIAHDYRMLPRRVGTLLQPDLDNRGGNRYRRGAVTVEYIEP